MILQSTVSALSCRQRDAQHPRNRARSHRSQQFSTRDEPTVQRFRNIVRVPFVIFNKDSGVGHLLTKQPALRRFRHLRSDCRSPGARPWTRGRLRRPWETSNSPKPSRGFQPEKGRFRPPLSSPLAGSSFATSPAPLGSLSDWDQRADFPLWTLQGKDHSPSVPAPSLASLTLWRFRRD